MKHNAYHLAMDVGVGQLVSSAPDIGDTAGCEPHRLLTNRRVASRLPWVDYLMIQPMLAFTFFDSRRHPVTVCCV